MAPATGADNRSTPPAVGAAPQYSSVCPPGARELLPAGAPIREWLAARRQGVGGSDASVLLGLNAYSSLIGLWLDKTGKWRDERDTEAMERGRWLEPYVRDRFTWQTGIQVTPCGLLQSLAEPLALYTPDGLTADGGLLEVKTTNWRNADQWDDDEIADHAELQVQHGLGVTGLPHAWVAVSIDGKFPMIRGPVMRDQFIIDALFGRIRWFWNTYVIPDVAPPLSGGAREAEAVRGWWPVHDEGAEHPIDAELCALLEQVRAERAAEKAAKRRADDAAARVLSIVGAAEYITTGEAAGEDEPPSKPLATYRANGVFASSRFREAEPELAAEFTIKKEAIDTDALEKAHPDVYARHRARVLRIADKPFDLYRKGA